MSQWIERIESHGIFKTLDELEHLMEMSSDPNQQELFIIEAWDRAKAVVLYARQTIAQADPLLIPPVALANIQNTLNQTKAEIESWVLNKNFGHWSNAHSHLDVCLVHLASLPRQTPEGIEGMGRAASEYRTSVSGLYAAVSADSKDMSKKQFDLQEKINEANIEVGNQKQRLDTAIATFQQQFSDSQQTQHGEFTSAEQTRATIAQKAEEARQATFDEAKKLRAEEDERVAESAAQGHKNLVDELHSNAKGNIDFIETQKEHAQKLVGIITNTGMAHGFQKTANEERKQAQIWSGVAVVSMSVWIITGCVFFAFTYDKDITFASVLRQFLISTPFVLLSGFSAMRVSQHQKNERLMRQSELEIASIDLFLATLSDTDRNEVKREFATRYFGQRESNEKSEPIPSNIIDLTGALVKVIQELTKK